MQMLIINMETICKNRSWFPRKRQRAAKALAPSDIFNRYPKCLNRFLDSCLDSADSWGSALTEPNLLGRCYRLYVPVNTMKSKKRSGEKQHGDNSTKQRCMEECIRVHGNIHIIENIPHIKRISRISVQKAAGRNSGLSRGSEPGFRDGRPDDRTLKCKECMDGHIGSPQGTDCRKNDQWVK